MPDKAGAFLKASQIISNYGGNIVRVNYNKAIDLHTLFIEVSASKEAHTKIQTELEKNNYLFDSSENQKILMIVLKLTDKPGSVTPVLEILKKHNVNISYMSSQENGTQFQYFKMGLLIENTQEMTYIIEEISKICEISILDYKVTDRLLDGTVFYVSFANETLPTVITVAVPAATPERKISERGAFSCNCIAAAATIPSPAPTVEFTATLMLLQ